MNPTFFLSFSYTSTPAVATSTPPPPQQRHCFSPSPSSSFSHGYHYDAIYCFFAHSLALFVSVFMAANISGGHLNPGVTFTLSIDGHITILACIFYWVAQLLDSTVTAYKPSEQSIHKRTNWSAWSSRGVRTSLPHSSARLPTLISTSVLPATSWTTPSRFSARPSPSWTSATIEASFIVSLVSPQPPPLPRSPPRSTTPSPTSPGSSVSPLLPAPGPPQCSFHSPGIINTSLSSSSRRMASCPSSAGRENAACALNLLGRDSESVDYLVNAGVYSTFAKVLKDGLMKVQAMIAVVDHDVVVLAVDEVVVRPVLVTELRFFTVEEEERLQQLGKRRRKGEQPSSLPSREGDNNTMMFSSQIDGGGFSFSQASQNPDSSISKNRGASGVIPLTVKQISEALEFADDKSSLKVDGVDATNIRLLGLVMSKMERSTDVTFTLDDGTGRIDVIRWVNETSDSNETAVLQNGMYVSVNGSLKGFQDKKRAVAFSVRPVTDYNAVALHFIQCIHLHLWNTKQKGEGASQQHPTFSMATTASLNGLKEPQPPVSSQTLGSASTNGSETDAYKMVLNVFQEPAGLASDHGLHIDEVAKRLGLPLKKIKEAIDYYVDIGHIYSTIDDYHFKSACG
ncbi:replication protein A 32 kDa subunit A-like [Canna indica]|uniref:Replication protein A 32 kDa subunit A-like n=1 Tax=Canna indica TaxID=4628 RepID=A0AAQ3KDV0_9LILI|nr:replication protein A 32 kDa subunit A-like [Canna indica]